MSLANDIKRAYDVYNEGGGKYLVYKLVDHFNSEVRQTLQYRKSPLRAVFYFLLYGRILYPSSDDYWKLVDLPNNRSWKLPHYFSTRQTLKSYKRRMKHTLFFNDYFTLEENDIVFETGSYIGATTQIAAEHSKRVIAIDPSPHNVNCLRYNLSGYDNVEIVEQAAWDTKDEIELQFGSIPSKDSVLSPTGSEKVGQAQVPANTISNIALDYGVEKIDFLKIEAEGVEPEVVEGIRDIPVKKIVIDAGPERDGAAVDEQVTDTLRRMGYQVEQENRYLYAFE